MVCKVAPCCSIEVLDQACRCIKEVHAVYSCSLLQHRDFGSILVDVEAHVDFKMFPVAPYRFWIKKFILTSSCSLLQNRSRFWIKLRNVLGKFMLTSSPSLNMQQRFWIKPGIYIMEAQSDLDSLPVANI